MSGVRAGSVARSAWAWLRRISGDDAYERYRAHQALRHPGAPLMNRREFCADEQQRKWGGISRCC